MFRFIRTAIIAIAMMAPGASAADRTLHIGLQKTGLFPFARQLGTIEQRLAPLGVSVTWSEFPSGPPLLEALNAGSIDLGYVGDAPPIFALAGKSRIVLVAYTPQKGTTGTILVPRDSPIASLADLKGKKVAYVRGSSAHNVLLASLASAGLRISDVESALLSPADAAAAFVSGKVDAWSIWDPFAAVAELRDGARRLTDAPPSASFVVARADYAAAHPDVVAAADDEFNKAGAYARDHRPDYVHFTHEATGVTEDALSLAINRVDAGDFAVLPITDAVIAKEQAVADSFTDAGLIPVRIDIAAAAWRPAPGL
ncbi:MAG: aliphatic sulfonate ABC transporter substrate-binding protein [Azospirillaceae bacterium]|nr:aliphatic sulfonate ABC transporter substrate-binding protein [Azospirillaceae bacterium]